LKNQRGSVDTGIYLLFAVVLGLMALAALAGTTGAIFESLGSGMDGFAGFAVTNFNVVLLIALTILGFIGVASFRE